MALAIYDFALKKSTSSDWSCAYILLVAAAPKALLECLKLHIRVTYPKWSRCCMHQAALRSSFRILPSIKFYGLWPPSGLMASTCQVDFFNAIDLRLAQPLGPYWSGKIRLKS